MFRDDWGVGNAQNPSFNSQLPRSLFCFVPELFHVQHGSLPFPFLTVVWHVKMFGVVVLMKVFRLMVGVISPCTRTESPQIHQADSPRVTQEREMCAAET